MRRTTALLIVGFFSTVLGCAGEKFTLMGTSVTPAARGEVEVTTEKKNGNTKVKIKVEHLAPPGNLTPPKMGYLVWFTESGGKPEPEGRLRIDKNLKASFETTTRMKSFEISVTAETDASIKAPTGPEVLRATVKQ